MQFISPMTMMNFFRQSEGTWFIQRHVQHFDLVADESGESNLIVNIVEKTDPRVKTACEEQGIDPALAMGGASFIWQDNLDERQPNPDYAAVLIDIPDDEKGLTGKLIRDRGYVEKIPVISRYWFGKDGILTIDTEYDNNQGQERCWFINGDFRVRVGTVRTVNGINLVSYCSERRCVSQERLEQMIQRNLARNKE
ncbi:MAG: phycobiliprotein lyase [Calothrix sp. C42_A2020_038]|nr:phycobiliprotein lyase [Calothrix sp. C42_A2020_038]